MKNSRYAVVVAIRVIFITLTCFVLIWLQTQTNRPATTLFALVLLLIQTGSLIYYHNRINRDLANFLVFLQENDTSLAFSRKRIERSFQGLTFHLDKINLKLQEARMERERQFQYLQAIVRQVDTGIIAVDEEGRIEIMNRAALDMLGIRSGQVDSVSKLPVELTGVMQEGDKAVSPVKIKAKGNALMLSVKSGMVKFDNRVIRLISFQNIRPELEAGELDAWRKLMRIQRHEIINSITPITTLTTAIKRCFMQGRTRKELNDVTVENIDDALSSVAVIEDRSLGLLDFVERFRSLTDLPVPKITKTPFRNLTDPLLALFSKDLIDRKITFKVILEPENLVVSADEKLLEQVFINVLKNALEAIRSPGGEIMLRAYSDRQYHVVIEISDNGIGIEDAALESVFIPSYTTKENGSGIGLSLSRQIIQLHGGTITVRSQPGVSTVFVITLPNAFNTL